MRSSRPTCAEPELLSSFMRANRSTSVPNSKAASLAKAGPLALGMLGVICFSLTFPATTAAERSFSPLFVGAGRSVIAAAVAAAILAWRRESLLPPRQIIGPMLVIAATVGIGFGLLSAIALRQLDSVHVAVIAGLIPAATAGMAAWRGGERPSRGYWAAVALGLAAVIAFAVIEGGGRLRTADLLILVAIAVAGCGYAEGGMLARDFDGWRVICWGVIVALPVSLPVTVVAVAQAPPRHVGAAAVLSGAAAAVVIAAAAIGRNAKVGRPAKAQHARADSSQVNDQVSAVM